MVVKRGAALAAGLVVVAGLVGGCAQKPGVAATATPVSCGKKADAAPAVFSMGSDGKVTWTCSNGSVVRGEAMTISTAEVADVVALVDTSEGAFSGADAIEALIEMGTVLRVAEEQGVTVSDDQAANWLDEQGYETNAGTKILAKYSVLATRASSVGTADALTDEQVQAINEGLSAAVGSLDIVVNPRFGTFDPEQFAVVPPTWVQSETVLAGL